MKNQKGFVIPLLVAIVVILAIGGGVYVYKINKAVAPESNIATTTATSTIVGNDRDAHSCIGSAGYTWCQVKNKCLRVWEEKCEATSTSSVSCQTDSNCREISCVGGGFAHEKCIEGKCTISAEVKSRCSGTTQTDLNQ